MNYAQLRKYDIANGTGVRCVLFVSGCTHHCKGCFNKEYQDFKYGDCWNKESEDKVMSYVSDKNVIGITILGGEPLDQTMDDDLLNLVKRIKSETDKNIWIYSGYIYEEIICDSKKKAIVEQCDVLVDGKFVQELADVRLKFRGSSNQRIIDIQESSTQNKIIERNDLY